MEFAELSEAMTATVSRSEMSGRQTWSPVGSMALCVALLIASEFMPVSLLTPIAKDLHATEGMTGQAISVSGLFAVITSLLIATIAGRFDRRHVLTGLTAAMLLSLMLIAVAPNFLVLMAARALLGIVIGGFWSLATATAMRLVPTEDVPKALGMIYMGNAVATAFAAPIGSYFGGIIGWRGVFRALVPIALANVVWQWVSLPTMLPEAPNPVGKLVALLKRRNVAFAMLGVMFTFAGAFTAFTYLRPFLETYARVSVTQLSLLQLFVRVCEGVQHAHQKAIIHRDLKPSHVLVTEVDGRAAPKIIDFGVAKAVTQKLTANTMLRAWARSSELRSP